MTLLTGPMPDAVREMAITRLIENQAKLIAGLKARHCPGAAFVGPYEQAGIAIGVLEDQWLWEWRSLVRGVVIDMSTPLHWHRYLAEQPGVQRWLISDLCDPQVSKLGAVSPVDIIGDFCADPPPVPPESADTILCISILEHAKFPQLMGQNLARILRPGGHVFYWCPYAYPDGHLHPDYWRIGRDGFHLLAELAELTVVASGEVLDFGAYARMELGVDNSANDYHHGVPVNTWMIARRDA